MKSELNSELRDLYQQVILDHHKQPRNQCSLDHCHRRADGHNPLCGDRIHIELALDGDGAGDRVENICFSGEGCAICTASASMMTECLKGKTTGEAFQMFEKFHDLLTGGVPDGNIENLGKLAVFAGVREFPMRVKCATLPWHTLQAALRDKNDAVTTE